MEQGNFFRKEALDNLKNKQFGNICKNTPLPYATIAIFLTIIIISAICFGIIAEFSEKYIIKGFLNTTTGVAHIYPTMNGIITQSKVVEGTKVKEGDELLAIKTTYDTINNALQQNEFKQLTKRSASIKQKITNKKIHLKNLKQLLDKKYIAANIYHAAQDEITNLESNLHQINMEMIKYKRSLSYKIFAPISGTITDIRYQTGQYINTLKPILNILPVNTNLIAELYIPVAKSGFINPKDKLILHYDAYPYRRFGVATGQIKSISKTIATDNDEIKPIKIGEPYYKVIAKIDSQTISLYGKQRPLHQGMTCEAIIYGLRKKVWQWIFDPIYNFYGELSQ